MVLNATFNNISVISWQSGLLVEETGVGQSDKRYCRGLPHYTLIQLPLFNLPPLFIANDHHGYDLMVVGFTTIYAISVYHN
jgi:hypothetical protein